MPFPNPAESLVWGIGLLLPGHLLYRLSLPSHRANGETFKSIFDLYRGHLDRERPRLFQVHGTLERPHTLTREDYRLCPRSTRAPTATSKGCF
jgi:hypothetical protein